MYAITLAQLAVALLGAGAYIYHCRSRGGYWKACAIVAGYRVERDHPNPYAALAAAASMVQAGEAQQAAEQARHTPAARAAYLAAWQATEGQPVPARFAAAEQAHRQATTPPHDEPEADEDEPEDEAEAIYQYEMRLAHRQAQENY